ncbi:hypothetical protein V6N13_072947 [Hibiscus sabdariffa]
MTASPVTASHHYHPPPVGSKKHLAVNSRINPHQLSSPLQSQAHQNFSPFSAPVKDPQEPENQASPKHRRPPQSPSHPRGRPP